MTRSLDTRFGEDGAPGTTWDETERLLAAAQLYWLTTVRADGRPHVTPLVGLWDRGTFVFCTGPAEQKAANLRAARAVAVTTGVNRWEPGTDVVVEGEAVPVTGRAALQRLSDAYFLKYGDAWLFEVDDDTGFGGRDAGDHADVFRVRPSKVLAFSRFPHAQTSFRPA